MEESRTIFGASDLPQDHLGSFVWDLLVVGSFLVIVLHIVRKKHCNWHKVLLTQGRAVGRCVESITNNF